MSRQGPHDEPAAGIFDDTPPHGQPPVQRPLLRAGAVGLSARPGDWPDDEEGPEDDGPERPWAHGHGAAAPDANDPGPAPVRGRAPALAAPDEGRAAAEGPLGERVRVTGDQPRRPRSEPRHARGRPRAHLTPRGAIVVSLLVFVALVGGLLAWYETEANPSGGPGSPVVVHVTSGEPMGRILASLADHKVIGSSFAFHLYDVVHGAPVVRPGLYQLHQNLSFSAVSALLSAGPNIFEVDVMPGTTIAEIGSQLSSLPGGLAGSFDHLAHTGAVRSPYQAPGSSLEGLLGTGAYRITPGETARTLLAAMVARFDAVASAAGLTPTSSVGGLSAYQMVTVASIAQKEGYFTRYMGKVARVIYNRLADSMPLDMTSTVLYSLGKDGGPVTPAEERTTSPYNTYLHAGLTPTPICTPSAAALAAAVHPPAGPWLYFELVTAKKGTMVFSATYTQQVAAEQRAASHPSSTSTSAPGATT